MRMYAFRIRYLTVSHSYALADYSNDRAGFQSFPIYAILCDGINFEFFSFNGKTPQPTFSRGVFRLPNAEPIELLAIGTYRTRTNTEFIYSLRPICETLFYFLLLAYSTGIYRTLCSTWFQGKSTSRVYTWLEGGSCACV